MPGDQRLLDRLGEQPFSRRFRRAAGPAPVTGRADRHNLDRSVPEFGVSRKQTIAVEGGLAQRYRAAAGPDAEMAGWHDFLFATRSTPLQHRFQRPSQLTFPTARRSVCVCRAPASVCLVLRLTTRTIALHIARLGQQGRWSSCAGVGEIIRLRLRARYCGTKNLTVKRPAGRGCVICPDFYHG